MTKPALSTLALCVASALLAGCASDGGGSDDAACAIVPIACIAGSVMAAGAQVAGGGAKSALAGGWSTTRGGTSTSAANVRTQADGTFAEGEVVTRYDSAGRLTAFEPGGFGAASAAPGPAPWLDARVGERGAQAVVANPFALGWEYQSFGVWNSAAPAAAAPQAASFGLPTPAAAVPALGQATFVGRLAGHYVSPAGQDAAALARVRVQADFGARSLGFAATDTRAGGVAAPHLNLSGTLTYAPGSATFSGALTNAAGTLQGSSRGKFYGPAAQELGGVFHLKSATTAESFTGAYGAKR